MANTVAAGRIVGSPLKGLCERVCIEVKRVLDGCMTRVQNQTFVLRLSAVPAVAVPPFTYAGCNSCGSTTFINTVLYPQAGVTTRVSGDAVLPVTVAFTDSVGNNFCVAATLTIHRDICLRLPSDRFMPFSLEAEAQFVSEIGSFLTDDTVSVTGCYVIINKVTVRVDMLVPSYGYCVYPECTSCGEDACNNIMTLPIFPAE